MLLNENEVKEYASCYLYIISARLSLNNLIREVRIVLDKIGTIRTEEKNVFDTKVKHLWTHLRVLVEKYNLLLKHSDIIKIGLASIVDDALFNLKYELQYNGIDINYQYRFYKGDDNIPVIRNLLLSSIMNIIDNSIWCLRYPQENLYQLENYSYDGKSIFINFIDKPEGYLSIVIADNGCGFKLPMKDVIKSYSSTKPDGTGLGLYIVNEVMKLHNGIFLCLEDNNKNNYYGIPEEYKTGAKVVLSLNRCQE